MVSILISDAFSWHFRTLDRQKQHGRVKAAGFDVGIAMEAKNKFPL
jgi:hypothetical protein